MSRMRIPIVCVACLTVFATLSPAPAAPEPAAAPRDLRQENAQLRRRVAQLEAQVQTLEAKVRLYEARPFVPAPVPTPAPNVPDMPNAGPRLQTPGPNWIPKEFNGGTYYLVPCAPDQPRPATVAPQKQPR